MMRVASVPILVFLGISVLDFKAQCTQQTDVRRVSSLIAPISVFLGFSVLVPMYSTDRETEGVDWRTLSARS